jgi:ATP adenylyltransferase
MAADDSASPAARREGRLWPAVIERSATAEASGDLHRIDTIEHSVDDGGVRFVVRVVSSLRRKDRAAVGAAPSGDNPFLEPEPELLVGAVSDTHLCLLNKYNVLAHHVLLVTRAFEDQERLLTAADWHAMATCLAEVDGLGFYNGGSVAGASQPHKHLQLVPLPLAASGPPVPMAPLLEEAELSDVVGAAPRLPFRHALISLAGCPFADPAATAAVLADRYGALLEVCGIGAVPDGDGVRQSRPYNLLVSRRWMLVVPRRRERFRSVAVNALGFAGSLFVRNADDMATIEATGPLRLLTEVAEPG